MSFWRTYFETLNDASQEQEDFLARQWFADASTFT
jgi:hypothetical protein